VKESSESSEVRLFKTQEACSTKNCSNRVWRERCR